MSKPAICTFLVDQAEWRDDKAAEYPDDERNVNAAKTIRMLARYIRRMPDNDKRLEIVSGLCVIDDVLFADEELSQLVSRFGIPGNEETNYEVMVSQMAESAISEALDAIRDRFSSYLAHLLERQHPLLTEQLRDFHLADLQEMKDNGEHLLRDLELDSVRLSATSPMQLGLPQVGNNGRRTIMEERARDLNQGAREASVSGGTEQGYFYLVWVPQSVQRRFLAN